MLRLRLSLIAAAAASLACTSAQRTSRVLPPNTHTPPAFQRQIQNALDAGDGDIQVKLLRQKVAADPDNLQARLELADAYRLRGYPDIALEHFRLAAGRFPDSGEAQLGIVKTLRALNLRSQAASGLEEFLKKRPNMGAEYYSWLGILRDETGAWGPGEAAHRAAVERAPKLDYLHNNLGFNLLKQGKNEEAAAEFREALKLSPNSAIARNNLGLALANSTSSEQAVKNWQSSADAATAHSNMAALLIEQGKYAEARKELEIALSHNRAHRAALRNLELLSRLEGTPATMPARSMEPKWSRFKTSIRRLFVGPLDEPQKPAANTASLR
jgi:tetratricopeptide (TPR) repeat protein